MARVLSTLYVATVSVVSLLVLLYTSLFAMPSMHKTRDGVPHLSPPVINPDTGDSLDLNRLVRHYRGD